MQNKDRQKMCTNCDGRIPLDAEICPYCATHLTHHTSEPTSKERHHQSLQDSLTALYTPPYAAKSSGFQEKKDPLKMAKPLAMPEKKIPLQTNAPIAEIPQEDDGRSTFWPILLLSIGANILTIGLLQLFFSDNGILRLEWNSKYWFVYCLLAGPLFFFGFKKANLIKN